jgi:hypothetical protein
MLCEEAPKRTYFPLDFLGKFMELNSTKGYVDHYLISVTLSLPNPTSMMENALFIWPEDDQFFGPSTLCQGRILSSTNKRTNHTPIYLKK